LRVFGCLCFPNTSSIAAHKLAPRSLPCIYVGPSDDHKGSRCFDPSSGRVLISRHVTFDEHTFPFSTIQSPPNPNPISPSSAPLSRHLFVPTDTSVVDAEPSAAAAPPPAESPRQPAVSPQQSVVSPSPAATDSPVSTSSSSVSPASHTPSSSATNPLPHNTVSIPIPTNDHVMCTRG
jgi:histone deacetylase 1/2